MPSPQAPADGPTVHPAVDVSGLTMTYAGRRAVDGATFTVAVAGVTAVLGPNGAGKTTTLETCEGFRPAQSGTVRVLGLDPRRDAAALHAQVGVMLQDGGIPSGSRGVEFIEHLSRLYADPLPIGPLAERLGLTSLPRTSYRRMSGGEQQRVKLACALVGRPRLVFLDEPTAGMDPHIRVVVWDLITQLRADGVTVVLSTHLMDEAESLADQVVILHRGRVVADGTPQALTTDGDGERLHFGGPAHLDLGGLLTALPADCTAAEPVPGSYRITGDIGPQVLATVTAWCAQHGVLIRDLRVDRRSLQDVFLELTAESAHPESPSDAETTT